MQKISEVVIADFKMMVADAEALLNATGNQDNAQLEVIRAKAKVSLNLVKADLAEPALRPVVSRNGYDAGWVRWQHKKNLHDNT